MKISEFQIWWDGLYHRYHIGKNRGFLLSRSLRKKWGNSWRLDRADFTAVLPRKMTWKLSQFLEHLTPYFASYVSRIEISTLPRGPASRAGSGDPHDISRTRILSKNACFCSQKLWTFLMKIPTDCSHCIHRSEWFRWLLWGAYHLFRRRTHPFRSWVVNFQRLWTDSWRFSGNVLQQPTNRLKINKICKFLKNKK